MLSVMILSVTNKTIRLSVIVVSVVAPINQHRIILKGIHSFKANYTEMLLAVSPELSDQTGRP
jgi:hypothetical protein